jgi:Fur family peroxide stress response transcriptional regulator
LHIFSFSFFGIILDFKKDEVTLRADFIEMKTREDKSNKGTTAEASESRDMYSEAIAHSGLRFTPQRRHVYDILIGEQNHPTATEVFMRAKATMPNISLATVYNCLETLVECKLVRQVNIDREPTRYCANLARHGHFICSSCGKVLDVRLEEVDRVARMWKLPAGCTVESIEINLRGVCPECNAAKRRK